jgi:O-antigen/teichoic acid export membrane protein
MRTDQRALTRAFLWLGSASVFSRLVDLGAILTVIGLVSPEQLGEASLAWTVITLGEPFANLGVSTGLLTVKQVDRVTLDSALWLSLLGGVGTALLVIALAPLIGWLVSSASVVPLIALGALKLVPASVANVPQQRLARVLRQREIAAASAAATLLSAGLRVLLALHGFGAWSFVLAHVGYSAALLATLWMVAPMRPKLRFDKPRARELLALGLPSTLGNAFGQWARNVDYLFVGAYLGVTALGLYRVAFDLAMEPVVAAGEIVARSAAPTLRRLARSPAELRKGFNYAVVLVLATALPLALAVFVLAPRLLEMLKDATFAPAASATRWLVVASVMRVLLGLYTPLAIAIGRPGLSLRSSLELLVLLSAALTLCIGALGGVLSIASAGIAWCAAVGLSLALTRLRFQAVMRALPA